MLNKNLTAFAVSMVLLVGCSSTIPGPSSDVAMAAETATSTAAVDATTTPARPRPTQFAAGPFPTQPDGVPFPTEDWPEADWPAHVDRTVVDQVVEAALADGTATRLRAVVVIHRGYLIYERYSPNPADGPGKIYPSYSMSKSFASALVGVLVGDGTLDVFAPAPISQWNKPNDPRRAITIDDLLRLTAGLDIGGPPYPDPNSIFVQVLEADDAVAYAAQRRLRSPPGTEFGYTDLNGILLGGIMADAVGSGYAFEDFSRRALLDKIGVNRIKLRLDPSGHWIASVFADTTARNFVKLGLLYLRDGVWDGERILPEGWVDYSRTPTAANPEYGAGWWLDLERPGVLYAIGHDGQAMAVDPAHDLTYVTLATDGSMSLPVGEAIQQAFEAAD